MARPRKSDEAKRHLVSIRLFGGDRAALEASAVVSGRSLGAEIEHRLLATRGLDEVGVNFIARVADQIGVIERLNGGRKWHGHYRVWSGVSEMLRQLAVERAPDDDPGQDQYVADAWAKLFELEEERRSALRDLRDIGIELPERPLAATKGSLGAMLAEAIEGNRATARRALTSAPQSDERTRALSLLDRVEALDAAITSARADWTEQMRGYVEAEADGRQLYRDYLQAAARQKRDAGEPFELNHFLGLFR